MFTLGRFVCAFPHCTFLRNILRDLGPIYTKRQRQRCDNAAMMLATLFSLKILESLQIGFATHFQATLLFSVRTESQASL